MHAGGVFFVDSESLPRAAIVDVRGMNAACSILAGALRAPAPGGTLRVRRLQTGAYVAFAPLLHGGKHGQELLTHGTEAILHARRNRSQIFAAHQLIRLHLLQLAGERGMRHFRHAPQKLIEAHRAFRQMMQYKNGPLSLQKALGVTKGQMPKRSLSMMPFLSVASWAIVFTWGIFGDTGIFKDRTSRCLFTGYRIEPR